MSSANCTLYAVRVILIALSKVQWHGIWKKQLSQEKTTVVAIIMNRNSMQIDIDLC